MAEGETEYGEKAVEAYNETLHKLIVRGLQENAGKLVVGKLIPGKVETQNGKATGKPDGTVDWDKLADELIDSYSKGAPTLNGKPIPPSALAGEDGLEAQLKKAHGIAGHMAGAVEENTGSLGGMSFGKLFQAFMDSDDKLGFIGMLFTGLFAMLFQGKSMEEAFAPLIGQVAPGIANDVSKSLEERLTKDTSLGLKPEEVALLAGAAKDAVLEKAGLTQPKAMPDAVNWDVPVDEINATVSKQVGAGLEGSLASLNGLREKPLGDKEKESIQSVLTAELSAVTLGQTKGTALEISDHIKAKLLDGAGAALEGFGENKEKVASLIAKQSTLQLLEQFPQEGDISKQVTDLRETIKYEKKTLITAQLEKSLDTSAVNMLTLASGEQIDQSKRKKIIEAVSTAMASESDPAKAGAAIEAGLKNVVGAGTATLIAKLATEASQGDGKKQEASALIEKQLDKVLPLDVVLKGTGIDAKNMKAELVGALKQIVAKEGFAEMSPETRKQFVHDQMQAHMTREGAPLPQYADMVSNLVAKMVGDGALAGNGKGIPPEMLKALVAEQLLAMNNGKGIEGAIAEGITKEQKGAAPGVKIDSEDLLGSAFSILTLPIKEGAYNGLKLKPEEITSIAHSASDIITQTLQQAVVDPKYATLDRAAFTQTLVDDVIARLQSPEAQEKLTQAKDGNLFSDISYNIGKPLGAEGTENLPVLVDGKAVVGLTPDKLEELRKQLTATIEQEYPKLRAVANFAAASNVNPAMPVAPESVRGTHQLADVSR